MSNVVDGSLTLQEKTSSSTTWTDLGTTIVYDNTRYAEQRYFFQDAGNDFYVNESGSNTITIDGNEHTFEIGAVDLSPDPNTVDNLKVNGLSDSADEEGEVLSENPEGKYLKIKDIDSDSTSPSECGNNDCIEIEIYDRISVSSDYWQYRVKFDDGSNVDYSESIYFSVGKDHNIPYVKRTEINSDRIYDFNTTQDRITNSDVYAQVKDDETDTYNVTLYDASDNSKVAEIQTGSDFKSMFAYAISDFFSLGDLSREDHFFTTSSDSFMSSDSTSYSYYFEVEDLNDGGSRLTPVYQFNTGTSTNQAPNITSVEGYNGTNWKPLEDYTDYGEFVNKIRVKVDDPDNDFHDGYLNIRNEYDDKYLVGGNTSNPVNGSTWDYLDNQYNLVWNMSNYNFSRVLDSGNFTADIQVSDYNQNNSKTDNWSVAWGHYERRSYSVCGQTSGTIEMNQSDTCYMNVTAECVGGECNSETDDNSSTNVSENTTVIADPKPVSKQADSNVKSSKQSQLLSLEYWRSWINKVLRQV